MISSNFCSVTSSSSLPQSFNSLQVLTARTKCSAAQRKSLDLQNKQLRRSANYHPTVWDHQLIASLSSPYTYERYNDYLLEVKQQVQRSFRSEKEHVRRLEMIDVIQRLGVGYHFEEEIKQALDDIYLSQNYDRGDVYIMGLRFRLLRQNLYRVHPEFVGGDERLMEHMKNDVKGLMSLYEASYLAVNGEDFLEESRKWIYNNLESFQGDAPHFQQTPRYWRMQRLEARNFLDTYGKDSERNSVLVQLAKLDFNLVQSIHQRDLIQLSRWWNDLGFKENLSFTRDRLVENFIWTVGITYEPQFSKCRIGLTKFICILTAIDDIYDVYGSLDELELFTDAVRRWDSTAAENLPEYMKTCYLAMFNFGNSISIEIQRDEGINVLPYIVKEWERLCQSYLLEARWFNKQYTPKLDEYLETAWISVGGPSAMVHSYILCGKTISTETLDSLVRPREIVYWASLIARLNDDLGTYEAEMERGDVSKSVQCYMNEKSVSEEEAKEHVTCLLHRYWKELNEACVTTSLPKSVTNMALNMARASHSIFEYGDGIGTSDGVTKDRAIALFVNPFEIEAT
ncbi:hypothetical protein ACHQM5_019589 [Ranunculus cassubicifolius]